jgi:predicted glutamine amidotransferase
MCRLLAYVAPGEANLTSLLTPQEFERYRQLSTLHGDGWGAAWWGSGTGVRHFNSVLRAIDDDNFLEVSDGAEAAAGIVHLRWATAGLPVCLENTHPFTSGPWRFAHNGMVRSPELLLPFLSDERREQLQGTTDSEVYFQLVLQKTDELGDIVSGLRAAIDLIRHHCGHSSLNCLILGEGRMVAAQAFGDTPAPTASLVASVGGAENLPEGHDETYYRLRYVVRDGALLVASTGVGVDGWEMLDEDTIIDADVNLGTVVFRRLSDGVVTRDLSLVAA